MTGLQFGASLRTIFMFYLRFTHYLLVTTPNKRLSSVESLVSLHFQCLHTIFEWVSRKPWKIIIDFDNFHMIWIWETVSNSRHKQTLLKPLAKAENNEKHNLVEKKAFNYVIEMNLFQLIQKNNVVFNKRRNGKKTQKITSFQIQM